MMSTEHILYSLSVVFEESKMGIGKEERSETEQSNELEECSSSSVEESNHPDLDVLQESNIDQIFVVRVHSAEDVNTEPVTGSQALSGSESHKWREAMQIEMNSMYKNDVGVSAFT